MSIPTARVLSCFLIMLWLLSTASAFAAHAATSPGTRNSDRNPVVPKKPQSSFLELKSQADALLKSGQEKASVKQFQAAIMDMEQALNLYDRLYKDTADPFNRLQIIVEGTIKAKLSLTGVYQNIGNTSETIKYCNQILELTHTTLPFPHNVQQTDVVNHVVSFFSKVNLVVLDELALNYQILHDYPAAIKMLNQRLAEIDKINDPKEQARTWIDIASNYGALGDYPKEISYLQKASGIIEKSTKPIEKIQYFGLLASTYFSIGDYEKAEDYAKKLDLAIGDTMDGSSDAKRHYLENKRLEAWSMLGNLNLFYKNENDIKTAEDYFSKALRLSQNMPKHGNEEFSARLNLAVLEMVKGNQQEAVRQLKERLDELDKNSGQWFDNPALNKAFVLQQRVSVLNFLAMALSSQGQHSDAIAYAEQAVQIGRAEKTPVTALPTLDTLGRALFLSGDFTRAEAVLREAIKHYDGMEKNFAAGDLGMVGEFDAWMSEIYEILQQVLIAEQRYEEALEISERTRARTLNALITKSFESNSRLSADSTASFSIENIKETAKQQNATIVEYSIGYDYSKTILPTRFKGWQPTAESKLFIWVVKPDGAVAFRQTALLPASLASPKKPATAHSAAKHESNSHYFIALAALALVLCLILLLTRATPRWRQRVPNLLFLAIWLSLSVGLGIWLVLWLNGTSKNPTSAERPNAAYGIKFAADSLIINCPVGKLDLDCLNLSDTKLRAAYNILIGPIEDLLPENADDGVVFIPQGFISYMPFAALKDISGSYLIDKHTVSAAPSIQSLALAGKIDGQQRGRPIDYSASLVVGNPSPMPQVEGKPLDVLPFAEKEAAAVAQSLNAQPILGKDATEKAIIAKMPKAPIIHFATHGNPDNFNGLKSWIALAPSATGAEDQYDGQLTAKEISNMKLDAGLVVLSACQTARGQMTGEGVIGLSRSFMSAGVPSAIVSLWWLPDTESTPFLMQAFYHGLLNHLDRAQALRHAMLETKKKFSQPTNWAAFVLYGKM